MSVVNFFEKYLNVTDFRFSLDQLSLSFSLLN